MHLINELTDHIGQEVILQGWLTKKRSSGKISFLQIRDGSGTVQGVASRAELSEQAWEETERVTQESTVRMVGTVQEDKRAPSGVEVHVTDFAILQLAVDFPITPVISGCARAGSGPHSG